MAKARYLVEAHVVEGRSVSELAAELGLTTVERRSYLNLLLASRGREPSS